MKIPKGLFFQLHQSELKMITAEAKIIDVPPNKENHVFVSLLFTNFPRDPNNWLSRGPLEPISDQPSERLLKLIDSEGFYMRSYRIKQFAVWTITQNPYIEEYEDFGNKNLTGGISDRDIKTMKSLFEKAAIPCKEYKVFSIARKKPLRLGQAIENGLICCTIKAHRLNWLTITIAKKKKDCEYFTIAITPETILEPNAEHLQDLIVADTRIVPFAKRRRSTSLSVPAMCLNMRLSEPKQNDYTVSTKALPDDLRKLINTPEFFKESSTTRQFAVWTVVDNPHVYYRLRGAGIHDGGRVERIQALLVKAGLEPSRYHVIRRFQFNQWLRKQNPKERSDFP